MSSFEVSSAASSVERTASLKVEGEKYTLKLIATTGNERKVKTWRIDSKEDEFHKDLVWLDRAGDEISDGTYNRVAKGSTFVFEGNRYPVEDQTPFEKPPANEEAVTKRPATLISRARDALRKFPAEDLIQLRNERDNRGFPNVHKEPDPTLDFIDRTQEQGELQQALTPAFIRRDYKQSKVVIEYATISGAGKTRWMFQAFREWSHHISDGTKLTASVVHLNFNAADGSNDCHQTRNSEIEPTDAVARLLLSRGLFESAPDLTWMGRGRVPESDLPQPSVIVDALFKSLFAEGKELLVVHLDELHKLRTARVGDLTKVLVPEMMAKAIEGKEDGKELTTKEAKVITEQAKAKAEAEVFSWITAFLGQICGLSDHEKSRYVVPIITHTSPSGRIIGPDELSALAYEPLRLYPLTMDQSWELLNAARRKILKERNDWEVIKERIQLDETTREMWSPCVALAGGHPALLLDSFHVITGTLDPEYNKDTRGHVTGQLVTNHRVEKVSMESIEVELAKSFVGKALKMEEVMDDDAEFESIFDKGLAWYLPHNSSKRARKGHVSSPFPYLLKLMERAGGVYEIVAHQLDPRNLDFQATKAMEYIAALAVLLKERCDPDTWVETDIKKVKNGRAVLTTQSENRPFMSVWPSSIEPATDFGGKVRTTMGGFTGILGQVKMQEPGVNSVQTLREVMEFAWFIGNQVKEGKLTIPVNAYFISSRTSPRPLANLVAAFRVAMSGCTSKKQAEVEAKKFEEEKNKSAAQKSAEGKSTEKTETKSQAEKTVDVRIVIRYLATSGNYVLNPNYQFTYIGRGLQGMGEGCAEMSTLLPRGIFASLY